MHIPDGFVDAPVALATGVASAGAVAYAVRRTGRELGERTVPMLGVTAAFVFATQMLNFPVAAGTSGHFLGAVLVGVLLGPWAAVIVLTAVLVVQALGMADGGITALGANIFTMGLVAGLFGHQAFVALRTILPKRPTGYFIAVAVASWLSIVAAAAATSVLLALSGTVPLGVSLPAMVSVHMVIGLGEALITVAVVAAVLASRPDLVKSYTYPVPVAGARPFGARGRLWGFIVGSLVVALALVVFVSPFASSSPDGLERVAEDQGFVEAATEPAWSFSPVPDYQVPGLGDERISTALAGLVGVLVLFAVVVFAGRTLARRSQPVLTPTREVATLHAMGGHEHTDHRHAGHTHQGHEHLGLPGDSPTGPDHTHETQ